MTFIVRTNRFCELFGKRVNVDGVQWSYYRLGAGTPVLWLTGGLRRAALACDFLEQLAARHTVIAPDYPPVRTLDEFVGAFDGILRAERVESFELVGQSYGGMLAQAYLAHRKADVHRLILSSTGPANYGRAWLPIEGLLIALARVLPEAALKRMLVAGLVRLIGRDRHAELVAAVTETVYDELTRADVVSHFAVAADLIRTGVVNPTAFRGWSGRVAVLAADDDPTQHEHDIRRSEQLFGRPVDVISLGRLGHAAVLTDPSRYVELLERALV